MLDWFSLSIGIVSGSTIGIYIGSIIEARLQANRKVET